MNQLGEEVKRQAVGRAHHDGGRTRSLSEGARVWRRLSLVAPQLRRGRWPSDFHRVYYCYEHIEIAKHGDQKPLSVLFIRYAPSLDRYFLTKHRHDLHSESG